MIHLLPNTASQNAYFSPFQARKYLLPFTAYLIEFKNASTQETFYAILSLETDNERYTKAIFGTDVDDQVNGSVKITESGLYVYTIWGQNSMTNLDPTSSDVVGVCEMGTARISAADAWTIPPLSIPDNVIYYE